MPAEVLLQVSEFTSSGIDVTLRKTIVEGPLLILAGSLATMAIDVAGTGWNVGDEFTVAGPGSGGIGKVTAASGGVPSAISIVFPGVGYGAVTGAVTTAISPSVGTGLTVTTTVTTNGGQVFGITGWSITSNVLTLTANNTLTTGGGQSITVQGFTGTYTFLNGTYTVTSATATTIVVPLTHANGSGTQQGVAVVQGAYVTGGIPISYGFVDLLGLPNPIGTIGPLATPIWIDVKSVAGSAFNYQVNTSVTPNLLLIYNGVTQVSNAAAITADTVQYRAEFTKNAF